MHQKLISSQMSIIKKKCKEINWKILRILNVKKIRSAYGVKFLSNWSDNTFNFYIQGAYGFFYSNFIKNQKANFVFIDIGANQGLYSILASNNNACKKVYAFEPVKPIANLLKTNLDINNSKSVVVIEKAVSNHAGVVGVAFNDNHTGLTSLESTNSSLENNITIETIDHNFLENVIEVRTGYNVIVKIDVEGHELTVLKELSKANFYDSISSIYYECDLNWVDENDLSTFLKATGFKSFKKIGGGTHFDVLASR